MERSEERALVDPLLLLHGRALRALLVGRLLRVLGRAVASAGLLRVHLDHVVLLHLQRARGVLVVDAVAVEEEAERPKEGLEVKGKWKLVDLRDVHPSAVGV